MPKWGIFHENSISNIQIYKFEKNLEIKHKNMQVSNTKLFHYARKCGKI